MGHSEPTCVERLLDDDGYLPLKNGGQNLDNHDQAAAEDQQGDQQQDDANNQIRETGIHKDVLA